MNDGKNVSGSLTKITFRLLFSISKQMKILLLSFCLLPFSGYNQNNKINQILTEISNCTNEIKRIDEILNLSKELLSTNSEATPAYINKALELSKEKKYDKGIAVALTLKARLLKYQSNIEQSFKCFEEAKLYAHLLSGIEKDTVEAEIYLGLGSLFGESEMLPPSFENYSKVEEIALRIKNSNFLATAKIGEANVYSEMGDFRKAIACDKAIIDQVKSKKAKQIILFNIGSFYLKAGLPDSAILYFDQCLQNSLSIDINDFEFMLMLNKGKALIAKNNHDEALTYINKTLSMNSSNKFYLSDAYNCLGICYLKNSDFMKAESYLKKAEQVANEVSSYSTLEDIYVHQELLFVSTQRWKEAYNVARKLMITKDSSRAKLGINQVMQTQLKLDYEMKKKNDEIHINQIRFVEKSKLHQTIIFLLLFTIASLAGVIVFLIRLKRNRLLLKQKALQETQLKDNLESSNKELVSKIMSNIQKKEVVDQAIVSLNELQIGLNHTKQEDLSHIIKKLQLYSDNKIWEEFDYYFNQVKMGFYENISKKFPGLTSADKRLCALLSLNLNTKEIAAITNLSPNSVRVFRTRIRKKLGINDQGTKLVDFLGKY